MLVVILLMSLVHPRTKFRPRSVNRRAFNPGLWVFDDLALDPPLLNECTVGLTLLLCKQITILHLGTSTWSGKTRYKIKALLKPGCRGVSSTNHFRNHLI